MSSLLPCAVTNLTHLSSDWYRARVMPGPQAIKNSVPTEASTLSLKERQRYINSQWKRDG